MGNSTYSPHCWGRQERILTRDQLLEASRVYDNEVYDRAIDIQILRLRRKIESDPAQPKFIVTERGAGYTSAHRSNPVLSAPGSSSSYPLSRRKHRPTVPAAWRVWIRSRPRQPSPQVESVQPMFHT